MEHDEQNPATEPPSPLGQFTEQEDEGSLSATCICGWYAVSRKRGKENRRKTINVAKNVHMRLKH